MIFNTSGSVIMTYKSVIDLRSANSITNAIQAIAAGDHATDTELTIRLDHTFFSNASAPPSNVSALMEAAGRLPVLERLELVPCINRIARASDCFLPVEALAACFEQAGNRLRILIIMNCCLTGTQAHFQRLATSVAGLAQLQAFYTKSDCRKLDWAMSAAPLSWTMESLTALPDLQVVSFKNGYMHGDLETAPLDSLGRLPNLQHLELWFSYKLDNVSTTALAQALCDRSNSTLRSLVLLCTKLGASGSQALGTYLSKETTKLKKVSVTIESLLESDDPSSILKCIVYGLGNAGSKAISFGYPFKHRETAAVHMREMLRGNFHITSTKLELRYPAQNPAVIHDKEVEFLLKTNEVGRGSVLRDDPNSKLSWMDLFDVTKGELDNIYYLVRSHPLKFAEFGLQDLSENMTPTNRTLKRLLRGHAQGTISTITSHTLEISSNVSVMKDTLEIVKRTMELNERIEVQINAKLKELLSITEKFQIYQSADLKGTAMQLNSRMIGVRDLVASVMERESREWKTALAREAQDLRDSLEGKLQRHMAGVASQTVAGFLNHTPVDRFVDDDIVPIISPDHSLVVSVEDQPNLEELMEHLEELIENGLKKIHSSLSDEMRGITKGDTNALKAHLEINLQNARSLILEAVNAKNTETQGSLEAFVQATISVAQDGASDFKNHLDSKLQRVHENINFKFSAIKESFLEEAGSILEELESEAIAQGETSCLKKYLEPHEASVENLRKLVLEESVLLHASFANCQTSVEEAFQKGEILVEKASSAQEKFFGESEKWQSNVDGKLDANRDQLEKWQTDVDGKLDANRDHFVAFSTDVEKKFNKAEKSVNKTEKTVNTLLTIIIVQGFCLMSLIAALAIFFYLESSKQVSIASN